MYNIIFCIYVSFGWLIKAKKINVSQALFLENDVRGCEGEGEGVRGSIFLKFQCLSMCSNQLVINQPLELTIRNVE